MYSFLNLLPLSLFPPSPLFNKMNFHTHIYMYPFLPLPSLTLPPSEFSQTSTRQAERQTERERCVRVTHTTQRVDTCTLHATHLYRTLSTTTNTTNVYTLAPPTKAYVHTYLCPFDNNSVGWEVDAPGKGCRGYQHLYVTVGK